MLSRARRFRGGKQRKLKVTFTINKSRYKLYLLCSPTRVFFLWHNILNIWRDKSTHGTMWCHDPWLLRIRLSNSTILIFRECFGIAKTRGKFVSARYTCKSARDGEHILLYILLRDSAIRNQNFPALRMRSLRVRLAVPKAWRSSDNFATSSFTGRSPNESAVRQWSGSGTSPTPLCAGTISLQADWRAFWETPSSLGLIHGWVARLVRKVNGFSGKAKEFRMPAETSLDFDPPTY